MFVMITEPTGNFPDRFSEFKIPPNLKIFASKSPNMNKTDLRRFFESSMWPSIATELQKANQHKALVIVDSWSSNKDDEILNSTKPSSIDIHRRIIPSRTTGMIQPLDVGFFRPLKAFVKYITDTLTISSNIDNAGTDGSNDLERGDERFDVWKRENWISLISFAHYTF